MLRFVISGILSYEVFYALKLFDLMPFLSKYDVIGLRPGLSLSNLTKSFLDELEPCKICCDLVLLCFDMSLIFLIFDFKSLVDYIL